MNQRQRGQVTQSAAEVYEQCFVPALFEGWAARVAEAARITAGQRVLDVACGTGVLARAVAGRVGSGGLVVGLDPNEAMLAVARRQAPRLEWRQGRAEALPFEDGFFDAVVSQFGLMFFEDRPRALREMARVLRPGGCLVVAVWDALEHAPGYAALTQLLKRLFGHEAAEALRAPFSLGDTGVLRALFVEAGLPHPRIVTLSGTARFPSLEAWVRTQIKGWTLAEMLDDAQLETLLEAAQPELGRFVAADGVVAFDCPAHVLTVSRA